MPSPFVPPDETRRAYHSGRAGPVIEPSGAGTAYDPVDHASYTFRAPEAVAREAPVALNNAVLSFTFETVKYRPPFNVTVRTEVDWQRNITGEYRNGLWVFELPGAEYDRGLNMKLVLNDVFWMRGKDVWVPRDQPNRHRHFVDREVFFGYEVKFVTNTWVPNHLVTLRTSASWARDVFGARRNDAWEFLLDRAEYPAVFEAKFVLDRGEFMQGGNLPIYEVGSGVGQFAFGDDRVAFSGSPSAYRHGYDNFLSVESPLEQVTVLTPGAETEYDVIVVGSGMGGGTLADALSDRGARTLVLDAGGLWFPVHMNELPSSEVDLAQRDELGHYVNLGGSGLVFGVHFNLGGRSTYWSGVIPRVREWEMRGLWPSSVRDYLLTAGPGGLSGYDRAERTVRKGKTLGPFQDRLREYLATELGSDFRVTDLPRSMHQPNMTADGRVENVLEKPTGVYSTVDLLLDSIGFSGKTGRNNIWVKLHHLTTRIETADGKATEVVCQDLVGKVERRYRGRFVVLACGSMESPKLAINSGLPDPNSLMGKGLTDHPAYFYKFHHELPQSGPGGWVGDARGHAKILIQPRTATPTQHAYNVELLINPKYWSARHADDDQWSRLVESERKSKVEIKFSFSSALGAGNFIRPRGAGEKPEVFVANNTTGDPFKAEVVEVRNRVLTALGVTGLSSSWSDAEWDQGTGGTPHHAGGTLRMSGDGTGVVDENLKFLGLDNLYCCDLSVFPTIPAANPALTLVALALRLGDALAARLGLPARPALFK